MSAKVKPAPEDWGVAETRERNDRADCPGQKADCCGDRVRFVAEIPRARFTHTPAHFRLCRYHAELLTKSDSRARVYPVPNLK